MLRIKEYKKRALASFYRNWKACIIICFLYTVLIGGTIISINKEFDYDYRDNIKALNNLGMSDQSNSAIVNEFINELRGSKPISNKFISNATRGVLGTLANSVSKTGSFLFGALNAINEALFKERIGPSVTIIIGAVISLFYWLFISKVLEVGLCRFFLENHRYTKTKVNKLILPYKLNKASHVSYTMFLKNIYTILWSFTIVGGFIKYYSYRLVPYILAENPNMSPKDVLKLSADLTNGYKWSLFKLDLSFIGYYLLGILTFNISNLVFTTPYINATYTEVYFYLKDLGQTKGYDNISLLSDNLLEGALVYGEYPTYNNMLIKESKWLKFNYERKYSFIYLVLIFFIISHLGFLWETCLHLFEHGVFVKKGTLYGPWLPIYGSGCVLILIVLKNFRKNPFIYFLLSMFICGLVEYLTSLYLEIVHHLSWWNYSGYFLNINGRVCLEGLLLFGIGMVCATYILVPIIANLLDKISHKTKIIICIILATLFTIDFTFSSIKPNTGVGITEEANNLTLN